MLPPLKTIKTGLRRTTEAVADELARPGTATPEWTDLEWRLATAAAAAHGVSPLLCKSSHWQNQEWRAFLAAQREHVERRHQRIATLLERLDAGARDVGLAMVALKGSALHAMGLYVPGERPMADIDLLVREGDAELAIALLQEVGYEQSFVVWKHRVLKPSVGEPHAGLGEHCDTPINIELHSRIQERLPISLVDITERIYPRRPLAGLNPYPSRGALMCHLLLHAAGNICNRSLRLLHLHDIALLSARMSTGDWNVLLADDAAESSWWALPPLRLAVRYYRDTIPDAVLSRLESNCPPLLRAISRRQTLTQVSCSALWQRPLVGVEWSRSLPELGRYMKHRFRPPEESGKESADMLRTQIWLQGQSWINLSRGRRMLNLLTRPVPRMDTLYVVRAAFEHYASAG
jgi:hypothetical protein